VTDEFEEMIAGSLRHRAEEAPMGDGGGFTDVRRRARQRRQRRMAGVLLPALAGVGYLATRSSSQSAPGIADATSSTFAGSATTAAATTTWWPMATTTSGPGSPGSFACRADSQIPAEGNPEYVFYGDCQWVPSITMPPATTAVPGELTGTDTLPPANTLPTTTTMFLEQGEALFLNASTVDGAAIWWAGQFGSHASSSALRSATSFVMPVSSDGRSRAEGFAAMVGMPVRDFDAEYLPPGDDLGSARFVVVIGDDFAAAIPPDYSQATSPTAGTTAVTSTTTLG
jgi:hypothetical protein